MVTRREGTATIYRRSDGARVAGGRYRFVRSPYDGYDELHVILDEWEGGPSQYPGEPPTYYSLVLEEEGLAIQRGYFVPPVGRAPGPAALFKFVRVPPLALVRWGASG
jgi:hypothetical protein